MLTLFVLTSVDGQYAEVISTSYEKALKTLGWNPEDVAVLSEREIPGAILCMSSSIYKQPIKIA